MAVSQEEKWQPMILRMICLQICLENLIESSSEEARNPKNGFFYYCSGSNVVDDYPKGYGTVARWNLFRLTNLATFPAGMYREQTCSRIQSDTSDEFNTVLPSLK